MDIQHQKLKKRVKPAMRAVFWLNISGFTMVELLVVIFFVALVATLATIRLSDVMGDAKIRAAQADLTTLREAFMGSASHPGYLADMEKIPGFSPAWLRIGNLLRKDRLIGRDGMLLDYYCGTTLGLASFEQFKTWDREAQRGWRGPYLSPERSHPLPDIPADWSEGDEIASGKGFLIRLKDVTLPDSQDKQYAYGNPEETTLFDPWGNPYVLQVPPATAFDAQVTETERFRYARLVSAGPNGVLDTPCYDYSTTLSFTAKQGLRWGIKVENDILTTRGDDIVLFLKRADILED